MTYAMYATARIRNRRRVHARQAKELDRLKPGTLKPCIVHRSIIGADAAAMWCRCLGVWVEVLRWKARGLELLGWQL